jgi:hypothetical protein
LARNYSIEGSDSYNNDQRFTMETTASAVRE